MKRSLILFLGIVLLGGCLSKPSLVRETFAIVTPPRSAGIPANGPVLTVQRILVMPPFDSASLTYRTGEFSYERDPYAVFLDSPASSFSQPIHAWLQNSGLFSVVAGAESPVRANLGMEVSIEQLYGDFRNRNHPAAVLQMRFLMFKREGRGHDEVVLQKTYWGRVPLKARTAAAVVAGWDEALGHIMKELTADLKTSVQ